MNTATWLWPQWVQAGLMLFTLVGAAALHGKPKGDFNIGWTFIAFCLELWILTAGGFFS